MYVTSSSGLLSFRSREGGAMRAETCSDDRASYKKTETASESGEIPISSKNDTFVSYWQTIMYHESTMVKNVQQQSNISAVTRRERQGNDLGQIEVQCMYSTLLAVMSVLKYLIRKYIPVVLLISTRQIFLLLSSLI